MRECPQVADYRFDLCQTYAVADPPGRLREHFEPGDASGNALASAQARLEKALAISSPLVVQYANVPEYRAAHAQICNRLGELLRESHKPAQALAYQQRALDAEAALAEEFPSDLACQVSLAALQNSLARTQMFLRDDAKAKTLLVAATASAAALLKDHADRWYLHALLAESNFLLADILDRSDQHDAAAKARLEAQSHQSLLRAGHAKP